LARLINPWKKKKLAFKNKLLIRKVKLSYVSSGVSMPPKIEMPTNYPFSIEIPIRRIDLSLDVHVSFATILDIVMEAYLAFFEHYKYNVLNLKEKSVIFANANIAYQGELLYKDAVKIDVAPDNFTEKAFDLNFRMTKNNETIPVAFIKIRVLFFDYSIKKVVSIPSEFKSLFEKENNTDKQGLSVQNESLVWKEAHKLVVKIYNFTKNFPKDEIDNLTSRIRKSATSLPLCIMEGISRKEKEELKRFLAKCRGYIEELRYYLILANDLGYADTGQIINELNVLNDLIIKHFKSLANAKKE
jgi:four helix bundle protein